MKKELDRKFGPQNGSTIVLSHGRLHTQPDMFDEYPDATKVQGAGTHEDFLKLVGQMKCMCCTIGRACDSNANEHDTPFKRAVAFSGNPRAQVVLVGEAPGRNEWQAGTPFIGKSGRLLRDYLVQSGFEGGHLAFMNCVMCRPTDLVEGFHKDRPPTQKEVKACMGNLLKQLELVSPFIVVAVGRIAATSLFGLTPSIPIDKIRGRPFVVRGLRWKRYNRDTYHHPVGYVTYHPASCLGNRDSDGSKKSAMRMDLEKLNSLFLDPKSIPYLDGSEPLFSPDSIVKIGQAPGDAPNDTTCH